MKNSIKLIMLLLIIAVFTGLLCACNKKPLSEENCDAGHNLVQSSYTAPTCKTTGEEVKKCSRCGFESKTTLLTINHDYIVKSTTESTCTTRGSQTSECSMCHETKTESLELKDHNYELISTTPSSCTVKGSKTYKCKNCDRNYSEDIDLLDHDYKLVKTSPSTCVVHGSKHYKCRDCTATKSEQLELAEHKYETKTVEATCFTHGGTIKECSVCHDKNPLEETPLLTHDFSADGYCTHCGIYETLFDIDKLNVSWIKQTDFGQIEGDLVTKFSDATKSVPDSYWKDHTVTLTISMYDKDNELLETHSFQSTTLPFEGANYGKLTIQYVRVSGELGDFKANQFLIFPDEGNIFSKETRQNCTSFKIELSCDGYKTIEKTYDIEKMSIE